MHIPLALVMRQMSEIATFHALLVLFIGVNWAVKGRFDKVSYIAAYIAGSEVLWRMNEARIFWEFGKYATAAILIVLLLRIRRLGKSRSAILYFILLLPSIIFMVFDQDWSEVKDQISFNLSGPFVLMLSVCVFSQTKLTMYQFRQLSLALIAPVVGITTVAVSNTISASDISFSLRSNFVTSGGFGPNQVSAALSLGTLLAFFLIIDPRVHRFLRFVLFPVAIIFVVQSALTFSRTGLFMAGLSITTASLFLLKDTRSRIRLIVITFLIFVIGNYFLLPRLDTFTDGALLNRFRELEASGRDIEMHDEIRVWRDNWLYGVGPGQSYYHRVKFSNFLPVASHTEYTRALAEHGLFGLFALILLLVMMLENFKRASNTHDRAIKAALNAWFIMFLLVSGMRLVAPAFVFGLASLELLPSED